LKTELVHTLTDTFEAHAQQADNGIEFWLARDLQHLLGYDEWRNFTSVINKAKTACEVSDHAISDHFVDVNKMVDLGSGSQREVDDIMLTRYACYLIAQRRRPQKAANRFCPNLLRHADSQGGADRTTAARSRASVRTQETHLHGKRTIRSDL